ncbi:hypothetical protein NDU88_002220 [Pleurodeles waltl]|uniref:Uncharacterized protein n=1 Tax=Pleurodeles waltl TaxID=8319 RepID=A0AAV7V9Y1_PLEWA|nr:hypothetical protein NDU88_002220 [Pleurodeles waltl]
MQHRRLIISLEPPVDVCIDVLNLHVKRKMLPKMCIDVYCMVDDSNFQPRTPFRLSKKRKNLQSGCHFDTVCRSTEVKAGFRSSPDFSVQRPVNINFQCV